MNKGMIVFAIVLLLAGTAIAPHHKDEGADLVIGAFLIAALSINPVRSGLWSLLTRKSKKGSRKGSVIFAALLIIFLVSLFRFGPVTTFEHIVGWFQGAIQWIQDAADHAKEGRRA